jgi:hypothetical protein
MERTLTYRAPWGLYFVSIQTVLKESHVPLGKGWEKSGLCCLEPNLRPAGRAETATRQGKMAPRMTQCMAQLPKGEACCRPLIGVVLFRELSAQDDAEES